MPSARVPNGDPQSVDVQTSRFALREKMRAYRASLSADDRLGRSERIAQHVLAIPAVRNGGTMLVYLSLHDEVDTGPLIGRARSLGIHLAAPRALREGHRLELRELVWRSSGTGDRASQPATIFGTYGIREPDPAVSPLVSPIEIDFVCLPGLAFDRLGNRLGYGAGYYDRFLTAQKGGDVRTRGDASRRPLTTLSLAFAGQLADRVPTAPWDMPVDYVVTEDEVIDCAAYRAESS